MKQALAILLAAALCLCLLAGCGGFSVGNIFHTYDHAGKYTAGGGTVDGQVENLDINWVAGSVSIRYHDGDEVILEESAARKLSGKNSLRYWLDGGTLRIQYTKAGFRFSLWPWNSLPAKELTVWLPERAALHELHVNAVSANVWAEDIAAREANVNTVSGDIDLLNVSLDDAVASTVSGQALVTLRGTTRSLDMNSVSGGLTAAAERLEEFEADTTSGDVELACGTAPGDISADTVSGSVYLYLPERESYALNFDSVSGDFHSELPFEGSGDRYTYGRGAHEYDVDTISGSVFLDALVDLADWY